MFFLYVLFFTCIFYGCSAIQSQHNILINIASVEILRYLRYFVSVLESFVPVRETPDSHLHKLSM